MLHARQGVEHLEQEVDVDRSGGAERVDGRRDPVG